jgi:hypothetical protein
MGLASLAVGHGALLSCDSSQRKMTFIEDMRTRLLGAKRVLGNIRNSVVAISDAIAHNLADGISRLNVVSIIPLTPADAPLTRVGIRKRSVSD